MDSDKFRVLTLVLLVELAINVTMLAAIFGFA